MLSDTSKSGHPVPRIDVLPYGYDIGADIGPRKRVRLDNADIASNVGDLDLLLNRRILQILGLPHTTSLPEIGSTTKYVETSPCVGIYLSYL